MKVLISGAGGFVGPHLTRELLAGGHTLCATDRDPRGASKLPGTPFQAVDLGDRLAVRALVAREKPDAIIHLAGWSHVGRSWDNPTAVLESNIINTVTLYEAAATSMPQEGLFLYISSADILGMVSADALPLTELSQPDPKSPYAVSKYAAELTLRVLSGRGGPRVIVARPFNHVGPGQSPGFVCPSFARQVAQIELGERKELMHGNLSSRRDFLDVRDVARAYRLILEKAPPDDVYIVASGKSHSILSIVERLFALAGIQPRMREESSLFRPADIPELRGSSALLMRRTGWAPAISLDQSLRDLLDEARAGVRLPEP